LKGITLSLTKVISAVLLLQLLIGVIAIYEFGYTLQGLQAVTRYSGRLSLALFSIIFILLPQNEHRLHEVLSSKPFLVFAIAHGIHLVELLAFVSQSGNELIPIRLAGGFLAYVMIFAMPVIQQNYVQSKIEFKNYQLLLTIYLYYVWFIFFMSYLPRVQGKLPNVGGNYWEFVVLLSWVCMMMGMKLAALIFQKRPSPR
jgi:hypothetical protein